MLFVSIQSEANKKAFAEIRVIAVVSLCDFYERDMGSLRLLMHCKYMNALHLTRR